MKAIILILTLLTTSAFADGHKAKGKRGEFFKSLNLTEEQKSKLKEHRSGQKGKMKDYRQQMKTLREELDKAFVSGASDGELSGLNSKMSKIKSEMEDFRFQKLVFMKNLLNADQRKMFLEKKKGFKGKMKGRFKKRN